MQFNGVQNKRSGLGPTSVCGEGGGGINVMTTAVCIFEYYISSMHMVVGVVFVVGVMMMGDVVMGTVSTEVRDKDWWVMVVV